VLRGRPSAPAEASALAQRRQQLLRPGRPAREVISAVRERHRCTGRVWWSGRRLATVAASDLRCVRSEPLRAICMFSSPFCAARSGCSGKSDRHSPEHPGRRRSCPPSPRSPAVVAALKMSRDSYTAQPVALPSHLKHHPSSGCSTHSRHEAATALPSTSPLTKNAADNCNCSQPSARPDCVTATPLSTSTPSGQTALPSPQPSCTRSPHSSSQLASRISPPSFSITYTLPASSLATRSPPSR
jgi:hypothetical protein